MIIEHRPLIEKWRLGQVVKTKQPPHITLVYDFYCRPCLKRMYDYLRTQNPTWALVDSADYKKVDDGWLAYLKVVPSNELKALQKNLFQLADGFTKEKYREHSENPLWHITICNTRASRTQNDLQKKTKTSGCH